jgi:hypothetical protein
MAAVAGAAAAPTTGPAFEGSHPQGSISMSKRERKLGKAPAWLIGAFALALSLAAVPAQAEEAGVEQPQLFLEDTSPEGFVVTVSAFSEAVIEAG